jgi:hypothetical protein
MTDPKHQAINPVNICEFYLKQIKKSLGIF